MSERAKRVLDGDLPEAHLAEEHLDGLVGDELTAVVSELGQEPVAHRFL
jgi:hypothetical protein